MVGRRTVVVGGLLSLALVASAVSLAVQPASRPGVGRASAPTPATTLVFGRLLPAATCDPSPCRRASLGLRRLKWQVSFSTRSPSSNQMAVGYEGGPTAVAGRRARFRIRLRPGCYGLSVTPYYPSGDAPSFLVAFQYRLRVGTRSPETVRLHPLLQWAMDPCAPPPAGVAWPGREATTA